MHLKCEHLCMLSKDNAKLLDRYLHMATYKVSC